MLSLMFRGVPLTVMEIMRVACPQAWTTRAVGINQNGNDFTRVGESSPQCTPVFEVLCHEAVPLSDGTGLVRSST